VDFYILKWATSREEALAELRQPAQAFSIASVPLATLMAAIAISPYFAAPPWTMFGLGIASQVAFGAMAVDEL
jgi:tellurite resistance protein